MAAKITRSMKKEITTQWNQLFPSMGVYKNMWLMNLTGPLAVGILLHIKSDKTRYEPTFHIHNLAEKIGFVTLSAEITDGFNDVSTISPPDKYMMIAERLKRKVPIPLEGDIKLTQIIEQLKAYCKDSIGMGETYDISSILMYLAGWSGNQEVRRDVVDFVCKQKRILLDRGTFDNKAEADKWLEELERKTESSQRLEKNVQNQIIELGMEQLPRRKILL